MSKRSDSTSILSGGAGQTVTSTYTGDATYVKPTVKQTADALGNVLSEEYYQHGTSTLLNKNTYRYDYTGNVLQTRGGRIAMENLGDYSTKTEYNYLGLPVKEYRADGKYTATAYDRLGRATAVTDYMGNTTTSEYDALGRVIRTTAPFEGSTTTESLTYYDGNGNVVKTKQQNNKPGEAASYVVTENEYDSRNRLVCTKVNDGTRDIYTQYAYDNVGNMVKKVTGQTEKIADLYGTMPEGATWETYEYDQFGNVTKATDALGQYTEPYSHDLRGNITAMYDRNNNWIMNSYNAYGSPLAHWNHGNGAAGAERTQILHMNTYSVNNLLIESREQNRGTDADPLWNVITYEYDKYGYLSKETEGDIIKTYVNDVNGNRKQFTLKEGTKTILTASYTYDKLDRPTGITFSDGVSVSYTYDDNGRVLTETRGSEVSTYTYNDAGFVTGMANTTGADYSFTYRLDGNQVSRTTDNEVTNYTYNNLGQLTGESGMDWQAVYTYDTRGNRATAEISDGLPGSLAKNQGTTSYTYDLNNRLLEETNAANGVTRKVSYEYDSNGNILFKGAEEYADMTADAQESLSMSEDGTTGTTWYTYDVDNRLIKMQKGYNLAEYQYDAAGRRSSKVANGIVTEHIWDGDNIVYEHYGVTEAVYYRGLNLVAQKIDGYISHYLYDQKGSVTGGANRTGTTEYDAFGVQRTSDRMPYNPFRYNGEYYDQESGLLYLRNRYYDPATGRFLTEDPAKDGLNWYVYCGGNPVNFVDPSGLDAIIITSSSAAASQGHTSALYQNADGSWYYTYWGNKAAAVIYIPDEYMGSLEDFNQGLKNILAHYNYTDITTDYDSATYIVGDFTASLQAAYDDVDSAQHNQWSEGWHYFDETNGNFVYQGQNSPYNVLYNNCLDRTYESLSKGTLANGRNAGEYMRGLGFDGGMIPNNATSKFSEMFINSVFTYNEAWWWLNNYVNLWNEGSPWARIWEKADYAQYAN